MSTENALSVPQINVPSTIVVDDSAFSELAKGSNFLGRFQLYTKGKAINNRLIAPGQYGIPESDDKITVLGDSVDVIPLARRAKAIDMSDTDAIVQSYDPTSETFKEIQAKSGTQDSGCMYGVSFLFYIPAIGRFVEYFAGTKTARSECGKLFPFLPTADSPAKVANLTSRVVESGSYSWHAPVIKASSTPPAKLPSVEQLTEELTKFLNPKVETAEKVDEATTKRRAR